MSQSIKHILLLGVLLFPVLASAKTHIYEGSGKETYNKKLKAGDVLVIPNGTYADLKINVHGKGKADKPITVRAESPGGVVLTGESWLRYWGFYIIVEGFDFQFAKPAKYDGKLRPLIANRRAGSSSTKALEMCHGCVLQRIRIDNESPQAIDKEYKWIELYGYENFVRFNFFGAKKSAKSVLQVQLKHAESEGLPARHRIFGNYFSPRNVGRSVGNGGEALLIGESSLQHVKAGVLVESNLFQDASIHGEPEVISNKSSLNIYRYNTIRDTSAGLTLRHGNENIVEYNWFFQNGIDGGSGIRIIGEDNTIVNNYIQGVAGGGKADVYRTALGQVAGYSKEDDDDHIDGYQVSNGNVLSNNTIVESAQPVMLSTWYDRDEDSMTRPPRNTTFTYNLVYQNGVQPWDKDWVRGQAISVDFTPNSQYGNEYGLDQAEYEPTFRKVEGNITDAAISNVVASGTQVRPDLQLKGCDAFRTGDIVYPSIDGAGANLAKMREPLTWTDKHKSPQLGPDWLNENWNGEIAGYTLCR